MADDVVAVVREAYEVFNRDAFDREAELDFGLFHVHVELDRTSSPLDGAVYRGHEGLRDLVALLRDMWHRVRVETHEFIPVGDDRVLVDERVVSVGREDVETIARAATLWTVREGRVARMKLFQSREEALAAVDRA